MRRVLSVALLVAFLCPVAGQNAAAEPTRQRVAVLGLANPAGLTVQEKDYLTNLVRASARKSLASGRFMIMTRQNIFDLLGGQSLADCLGECAVETGRNLGAAYVVAGEVVRFGQSLRLNLTLHETDSGNMLSSVQVGGATVEDLEAPLIERGGELYRPLRSYGATDGAGWEEALGGGGSVWSAPSTADVVVRFESEPSGALVEVDGMPLCETPCSRPLPAGTSEVAFKLLRYVPSSRLVEVAGGMGVVRADLTPNFGWFSVTSEPAGLSVEVDGDDVGVTPLLRREIGLGAHEVWVRGAAWHDVGERVVVERGEHQEVRLAPQPINGGLKVQAVDGEGNAVDGEVLIAGRVVGRTWATFTVQAGDHEVEVAGGVGRWRGMVTVPAEELLVLDVEVGGVLVAGTNSLEMVMVWIEAGQFRMGSPTGEFGRDKDERPHHARLTRGFLMGATEVAQVQYESVMGKNPSRNKGNDRPVENVSWYDCVEFCNRLSEQEGLTPAYRKSSESVSWDQGADGYRLPTEAEWEFACRAGTTTQYSSGIGESELGRAGWYGENSGGKTHPVGQKIANGWGLFDMHGNVWEWCWDWYGGLSAGLATDPVGPDQGSRRLLRGGGWGSGGGICRSANRNFFDPSKRIAINGFRVARSSLVR